MHRVRSRATFDRLGRARAHHRGALWVRRVDGPEGPPQVAYAVGRRVGNAVTRNRLRRRLRSAVATEARLLRPGSVYLIGAAPRAGALSPASLRADLVACLEAAR